ncbi:MAG: hypothetical protein R3200_13705 [Xanthomonadales bacterium]|nr:hypothetical protein [Xanthomonadales bacterium]
MAFLIAVVSLTAAVFAVLYALVAVKRRDRGGVRKRWIPVMLLTSALVSSAAVLCFQMPREYRSAGRRKFRVSEISFCGARMLPIPDTQSPVVFLQPCEVFSDAIRWRSWHHRAELNDESRECRPHANTRSI